MVAERDIELVGLHTAVIREFDTDESLLKHRGNVIARHHHTANRLGVCRDVAIALGGTVN